MSIHRAGFILLAALLLAALARPGAAQQSFPPVYNPANGHWYQAVPIPGGIPWPAARAAAAAQSYAGYPGHLVTITSAAEDQFLVSSLPLGLDNHWRVGGYQDQTAPDYSEPAGGWRWVTGEPWSYTNWHAGEPNNFNGENLLEVHSDGTWNDTADQPPGGGYIVEYEPLPIGGGGGPAQVVLFPNPIVGGQPAIGEVTLAQPAGIEGVVVSLASSNPAAAAVPAVVTVPPGLSAATFVIVTFPAALAAPVTIRAGCSFGIASATLLVLPGPAGFPAGNLLVNGSFEEPRGDRFGIGGSFPGWQILKGTIDILTASYWQSAPDGGSQSIDLVGTPGAATIEQSFPTEPGREYLFAGWIAHNPGIPEGRANVFLNGQFFVQLFHRDPQATNHDMRWVPFSYLFVAAASTTTLTLTDVTYTWDAGGGLVLDGLSVTAASALPPPSSPFPPPAVPHPQAGTRPAAPTGLAARAVSAGAVTLTWTDNSDNETAFAIWRRDPTGTWSRVGVVPSNSTAFTDTGLTPGTTYTYRVRAINNVGASDWSNEVTVTTLAGV